MTTKTLAKHSK